MKLEVKSSIVLVTTLLIGIALGMVLQGRWRMERAREVGALQRPQGFVHHMTEIIQPRADQRDAVIAALQATAEQNGRIIDSARTRLRNELTGMQGTLAPVLDADQRKRLADISRLPDPFRPPPPGGPGGRPGGGPRGGPEGGPARRPPPPPPDGR